jgi:hypothetical protein
MTPKSVELGERYADDSGWQRRLVVNARRDSAIVELSGGEIQVDLDDLWWLVRAAITARDLLGMDKFVMEQTGPERRDVDG